MNNWDVGANIGSLRKRIASAAERAGRDPAGIKIVAVSKTKPEGMIREAYGAGLRAFGENYAQELCQKESAVRGPGFQDIEWHMIGHIQTNKVKQIIGKTALIHSLDSIRLAHEIQKNAEKNNIFVDTLIEINVARENSKYGFYIEEAAQAVENIAALSNIRVLGLMTSAPLTDDQESNRIYFRRLYELYLDMGKKSIHNIDMCVLSMGMSGDFEVAIEEGATLVRIGALIFGPR